MRLLRKILWCGICAGVLGLAGSRMGSAFQRGTPPPPPPPPSTQWPGLRIPDGRMSDTPMEDGMRRQMESKRGRMISAERRKSMIKESDQIVQMAADLQVSMGKEQQGAEREEAFRRADTIEKLAKSVKERMKGDR